MWLTQFFFMFHSATQFYIHLNYQLCLVNGVKMAMLDNFSFCNKDINSNNPSYWLCRWMLHSMMGNVLWLLGEYIQLYIYKCRCSLYTHCVYLVKHTFYVYDIIISVYITRNKFYPIDLLYIRNCLNKNLDKNYFWKCSYNIQKYLNL